MKALSTLHLTTILLHTHHVKLCVMATFICTVLRDTQERGRDLEQVLATYANFIKPAFEEFCLPVS